MKQFKIYLINSIVICLCFGKLQGQNFTNSNGIKIQEYANGQTYSEVVVDGHANNSDNAFNIVFLGDGFRMGEDQEKFNVAASDIIKALKDKEPFKDKYLKINFWKMNVISAEEGIDHPSPVTSCNPSGTIEKNTALNCRYGKMEPYDNNQKAFGEPQRVIASATPDLIRNLLKDARVPHQAIMVIANDYEYGGLSLYGITYVSLVPNTFTLIALHELAHSIGRLADEYKYFYDCPTKISNGEYKGHEPTAVNLTKYETGMEAGKNWPNIMNYNYANGEKPIVGGGSFLTNIWHPDTKCFMGEAMYDKAEFDLVCKRQLENCLCETPPVPHIITNGIPGEKYAEGLILPRGMSPGPQWESTMGANYLFEKTLDLICVNQRITLRATGLQSDAIVNWYKVIRNGINLFTYELISTGFECSYNQEIPTNPDGERYIDFACTQTVNECTSDYMIKRVLAKNVNGRISIWTNVDNQQLMIPSICSGKNFKLEISDSTNTTGDIRYDWRGTGTNFRSTNPQPLITNSTSGDTYLVTVTNNGCTLEGSIQTQLKNTPSMPIIQENFSICSNTNQNITPQLTNPEPGTEIQWFFGLSSTTCLKTGNTYSFTHPDESQAGIYQIRSILDGCYSGATFFIVNILLQPQKPIISSVPPLVQNIHPYFCKGIPITLEGPDQSGTEPLEYIWTIVNNNHDLTKSYKYTRSFELDNTENTLAYANLQIIDHGCTSEISDDIDLGTYKPTKPSIRPLLIEDLPCLGKDLILEFDGYDRYISSYEWSKNNSVCFTSPMRTLDPNGANPQNSIDHRYTITNANASDAGIYQLKITRLGCVSDISEPQTVIFRSLQPPTIVSENQHICIDCSHNINQHTMYHFRGLDGATFEYKITEKNHSDAWKTGVADMSTNNTITIDFTAPFSGELTVIQKKDGCVSLPSEPLGIDVVCLPNEVHNIQINIEKPGISNYNICEGRQNNISIFVTGGNSQSDYTWNGPNGYKESGNQIHLSFPSTQPLGIYTYRVSEINKGCTLNTETGLIRVHGKPNVGPEIVGPQRIQRCDPSKRNCSHIYSILYNDKYYLSQLNNLPTSFKWEVDGGVITEALSNPGDIHMSRVSISWNDAISTGQNRIHQIKVTPFNECGDGPITTIPVLVE